MTKREAKWTERVWQWRASGKTAEDFAQPEVLGEPIEARRCRGERGCRQQRPTGAREASTDAPVLVLVGNARVKVHAGFDETVLRKVVDVLGGTR